MYETNEEIKTNREESIFGIWAFGLIIVILGAIAILYYLRYVCFDIIYLILTFSDKSCSIFYHLSLHSSFMISWTTHIQLWTFPDEEKIKNKWKKCTVKYGSDMDFHWLDFHSTKSVNERNVDDTYIIKKSYNRKKFPNIP